MGLVVQVDSHCMYCGKLCTDRDEYTTIKSGKYKFKRWFHKECYTEEEHVKCNHSKPEQ